MPEYRQSRPAGLGWRAILLVRRAQMFFLIEVKTHKDPAGTRNVLPLCTCNIVVTVPTIV